MSRVCYNELMANKGIHVANLCYNKLMTKRHAGGILLAALLLSFAALVPKAFAKEDSIVGGGVNVYTDVEAVLRVNIPDDITLKIDPGSKDPYTIPIKLNIYTNNPDGYNSFLSTNKNESDYNDGTATALVHQEDSNYKIDALAATASFDDFPAGFWGYSTDGGKTFESLPAADDAPADANTDAGLYFGVKVPEFQASGRYTNTVVVSVVTRYVQTPADLFDGIEYMQDMTQQICETENSGASKQLIDSRDDKVYWVTKMRDNSCWMTQNLDFEIASTGTTLTPDDSNVFATRTIYKEDARGGNDIFYQDGGDFYVPNGDEYDDNGNPASTAELAPDSVDWHYHVGSIYSWPAATAGSGNNDIISGDADESICPKGWRLPIKVSNVARDRSYSFYRLFMSQPESKTSGNDGYSSFTLQAVGSKPFYFIDARNLFTDVNYDVMPFLPEQYNVGGYQALRRSNRYLFAYWTSTSIAAGVNSNDSQGVYSEGYSLGTGNMPYALNYLGVNGYADSSYNNGATILGTYQNSLLDTRTTGSFVRCVSSKNDLYSISTMQEITQEIIDNTDIEDAKQLVDTRDGKKYWVTKEYDGNIWMTQNLDFEISTSGTTLTPNDSDVLATKTITAESSFGTDPDGIYYLDEGNYYYYSSSSNNGGYYDIYNNGRNLYEYEGKQAMHGHGRVGDFYSWNAATAGSGSTISNDGYDAPESICPKGWSLPTNGGASDISEGSYDNMIMAFLVKDDRRYQDSYYDKYYYSRNYAASVANPPLYYHFTGVIGEDGNLTKETNIAAYWSSRFKNETQSGDKYAYQFKVISTDRKAYQPNDDNIEKSYYGAKVRCVAVKTRSFSLDYDANGGIGAPASQYGHTSGDTFTFTLSDYVPIRAGLEFRGWATSPDAINAEYQPGDNATFQYGATTLYAIWGPKLIITFDANGGYGSMSNQVIESGVSKTLYKNTYRHDGIFKFLGWSINRNATEAEYKNGGMYTVPIIAHDTNITLYAVWQELSIHSMQDFDCDALSDVGDSMEISDLRDESTYTVTKLADGHCWMTENLKLDFANLVEDLSANNTNSPATTFMNRVNQGGVTSVDYMCDDWDQSCFDSIQYNTSNIGDALYDSYGGYYNWYTATAGNGDYYFSVYNNNVNGDLCPYSWRLPTRDELYNLYITLGYNQTALHSAPNNFMYSGYRYGSYTSDRDYEGYYWSSTVNSSGYAYYLYLYNNYVGTSDSNKYMGYSVRCLAK